MIVNVNGLWTDYSRCVQVCRQPQLLLCDLLLLFGAEKRTEDLGQVGDAAIRDSVKVHKNGSTHQMIFKRVLHDIVRKKITLNFPQATKLTLHSSCV